MCWFYFYFLLIIGHLCDVSSGCICEEQDYEILWINRDTVVKWVSIIWLFGKKNNASKKIWEFVVPEIFRILVNELSKLAQKTAIFC